MFFYPMNYSGLSHANRGAALLNVGDIPVTTSGMAGATLENGVVKIFPRLSHEHGVIALVLDSLYVTEWDTHYNVNVIRGNRANDIGTSLEARKGPTISGRPFSMWRVTL